MLELSPHTHMQSWTKQSRPVNSETTLQWYLSPLLELEALSSRLLFPCTVPHVTLAKTHGAECREFQQKIAVSNINRRAVRHNTRRSGVNVSCKCCLKRWDLIFLNIQLVTFLENHLKVSLHLFLNVRSTKRHITTPRKSQAYGSNLNKTEKNKIYAS